MNTIIALKGRSNSGKSRTIRLLHNLLLLQNDYRLVHSTLRDERDERRDFNSTFSKEDKLIGLTSWGDTYDLVHSHLQELLNENCNVCVCACRTYDRVPPGTNAAIREFQNYQAQFIEKTIDRNVATQNETNTQDAHLLLTAINRAI
jgi:hypothetical protein